MAGITVVVGISLAVFFIVTSSKPNNFRCMSGSEGITLSFTFVAATATSSYTYSTDGGRSWSAIPIKDSSHHISHSLTVSNQSDGFSLQSGNFYKMQIRGTKDGIIGYQSKVVICWFDQEPV